MTVDNNAAANHSSYSRLMQLTEILARRRMVRAYGPEPVPPEAIERIVGTIRRAPSAGFSQGQRLVVVTDSSTRRAIEELLGLSEAPVLIVVGVREDDYHERYRKPDKLVDGEEIEWPIPYWHFDAGAAAMLILLAAIDEGYAAGLFGCSPRRCGRSRSCLRFRPTLPSPAVSRSASPPTTRAGMR